MRYSWSRYLGARGVASDPLVALLQAELAGLPPATIVTAEYHVLREEGEHLAARLTAVGAPALAPISGDDPRLRLFPQAHPRGFGLPDRSVGRREDALGAPGPEESP
jgi:acetyl esterase/lipase